ncbi:MAG: lipid-transfer protein, partial [Nitriliruptorales bacterium]|nr:lipid-transfer protein [Nitriliruptorales bacterium]
FSKNSGRTELQLAAEAVKAALADAQIDPKDVDGLVTFTMDNNPETDIAIMLGMGEVTFTSRIHGGGGASCATVHHAAMAVATGQAEIVVCYRAFNEASGRRYGSGSKGWTPTPEGIAYGQYFPFGFMTPAAWVAMYSRRYMHEFGVTSEDLANVSIGAREWGATNPAAIFHGRPITLEEHQASKFIVEPLRLLDCCLDSDGGVAIVVTTPERARDLPHAPAIITAAAEGFGAGQEQMTSFYRPEITRLLETRVVADQIWEQAQMGPEDIQVANIYDPFSPFVLIQLEEYGFVKRGEAHHFVNDGHLRRGGDLPTNTNGGQFAEAYIHGMNGIAEAVRQVRGTSVNQVDDVTNVLVTAGVGVPTSGLILSKDD